MRKGSAGGGSGPGLYHHHPQQTLLHQHHPQQQQQHPLHHHQQQLLQQQFQVQQQQQQQQVPQPHHHHHSGALVGGGGPLIPPQQQYQQQPQQQPQFTFQAPQQSMVQQRAANVGGSGRVFVNNHHQQQQQQVHLQGGGTAGGNPYLQGSGIVLQPHHQLQGHHGPPGGGPSPLQAHHQQLLHHLPQGSRPLIPHGGAGFGSHPSGMGQGMLGSGGSHQFGGGASVGGINSHFGTSGGAGGGGSGVGTGHSSSGGGDLPPVETVVARLETACRLLHGIGGNNTRVAEISSEILILSEDLRRVGALLENTYPEVLDRVMSSMRDASAQPCLPPSLRLAIFELVELRASKWILPSDSSNYYRQRRNLNDAAAQADLLSEERSSGRSSAGSSGASGGGGGSQVTVVVTGVGNNNNNGNPIKPEAIFPGGGGNTGGNVSSGSNNNPVDLDTPPPPQPAKTYREEIVIKNSDSGKVMGVRGRRVHLIEAISDTIISFEKVAPTAKERVLSINGYSQQSINLAKQLIQETITRNASPVLDGMVLPAAASTSPAGLAAAASGDYSELGAGGLGMEDAELALKRLQLHQSSGSTAASGGGGGVGASGGGGSHSPHHHHHASHFSYTVTLGEHSIKILGDDLQYVQEAKMALDDYFQEKYPDLFCANELNGIEDVEEEDEEEEEEDDFMEASNGCPQQQQRYDRDTLLLLAKTRGSQSPPDFSHLEPDIRGNIVLEKPRQFDLEKFAKETNSFVPSTTTSTTTTSSTASSTTASNNKGTSTGADVLPG